MTNMQAELEALDKAARQTTDDIAYYSGGSKHNAPLEQLHTALINAYRSGELIPRAPVAAPTSDVEVIDIEKGFWEQINTAANASPWIPREHYFMNDWVADVCRYLKTGNGDVSAPTGDALDAVIKQISADLWNEIGHQVPAVAMKFGVDRWYLLVRKIALTRLTGKATT